MKIDDYFDDTVVNDKHLPNDVIDVVEEYNDTITYLVVTKITDGDWTKITNADKVYERIKRNNPINYTGIINDIEVMGYYLNGHNVMYVDKNDLCYKYVRLIYDDGGENKKFSEWTF